MWKTPGSYRTYPGGKELPAEMKVWRVQNLKENFQSITDNSFNDFGVGNST